jgi:hypothetical protein
MGIGLVLFGGNDTGDDQSSSHIRSAAAPSKIA